MRPKRVILVRHGDDPPDDRVHTFLHRNGFEPAVRRPFRGDRLDDPIGTLAGAVLFGGPFNVFDTDIHAFLDEEYRLIDRCMAADLPLLGICQGAQQIAYRLGAEVGPPREAVMEFGYYEMTPTPQAAGFMDAPLMVAQSHFHTFAIPAGAVRLAGSALFPNQAFRHGERTFAVQFHPELTVEGFRRWQETHAGHYGQPGVQTKEEQDALMLAADAAQAKWFYGFLESLFGSARSIGEAA